MGCLFVDADTGCTRKVVSKLRRRTRAIFGEQICTERVELACGHTGFCCIKHTLQNQRDYSADAFEAVDICLGFYGHVSSLYELL